MISKRIHIAITLLVLSLALSLTAMAQTVTGSMEGNVMDQTGAIILKATVTIRNVETGQERTVTTNNDGFYRAPFLSIGAYKVTVTANGFGSVAQENIQVTLNQTVVTNFSLKPATTTETVTIKIDDVPINTTNAEIKQSLNAQEITDRPVLNQGSFLTLAETFTGYQENPTSGQNNPTASSGSSINFNGTGTRGATFQINGVNNDDSSENQNRQGASLATIREFQVISNSYSAEFGRGYGAVVLVQTKSGTNRYHGELYEYHNDSFLNAKSHFATGVKKPVNRRNQYGGVIGFPIFQNKFFGFASFDQVRRTGAQTYTRDVLLADERTPRLTGTENTPANRAFIESVIARFPTNLVPNDSRSTRTHVSEIGIDQPLNDYSVRLDWNASNADTVTARYQYTRQIFDNQDLIIGEATKQNNKQQNVGLTWTHTFSNTAVGEFRYGLGLRTTLVGIKAGDDTPIVRFVGTPVAGSTIGNAGAFPINRFQTDHQFVYNFSFILGNRHFLKAGTDIRRQQLDDKADNFSRGFYNFSAACGGTTYPNAYVAFLSGCVTTFQKGYGPFFLENRINESNFYLEDNWKIKPNLTINLGARYEYVSAPREAAKRIAYGFGDDKNNIQPRVGFAYSPNWESGLLGLLSGGAGKSSLRGGYGIYHGRLFQSVFSQAGATVRFNPPNAIFLSFANSRNLSDPTGGFVFTPGPQTARHAEAHIDPDLEMPYTQQWTLTAERQMPLKSALRITYSGNRGIGLLRYAQENLPVSPLLGPVTVANHPNNAPTVLYTAAQRPAGDPRAVDVRGQQLRLAADPVCAGTGLAGIATNATCPVAVPIGPNEISLRVPRINERRPSGDFTTNTLASNGAWSYYHGMQVEWNKKLSKGWFFQMSYTWSKAIDTTSEATFVGAGDSNALGPDPRVSRGLSRFHSPHRYTFFTSYELPKLTKYGTFVSQALGGWKVSMVAKFAAGTPFTVTNSAGFGDFNFDGFGELRPVVVDPGVLGNHFTNPDQSPFRLPREAFRAPTINDYNCCVLGRNTFYADGVDNYDFSIFKSFRMPFEGHQVILRADMFNAFNHVQYAFPNPDLNSATFGRITTTAVQYAPRNVQFSLRYTF
ncbi:MAG: TonB-dependent receptor domain-containing protein [Blastocatellia bacterium]